MSPARRAWTGIALLILASVLLGLVAGRLLRPAATTEIVRLQADPSCDLRAGPCELAVPGGGRIRFAITPRDIPVGRELKLSVDLEALRADRVVVDIDGVDMDMGLSPYPLQARGGGHFEGPGGLNFCSRGIMEWEAKVTVRRGSEEIIAPFRFITEAPDPAVPLNEMG
ncbi:MAG: hypothetical protein D6720_09255 [Gammaproteobacteria bacterium]|nr:MAG: hypothetical protein D6720_09255 [Gammaproteobacteria bacterium]